MELYYIINLKSNFHKLLQQFVDSDAWHGKNNIRGIEHLRVRDRAEQSILIQELVGG